LRETEGGRAQAQLHRFREMRCVIDCKFFPFFRLIENDFRLVIVRARVCLFVRTMFLGTYGTNIFMKETHKNLWLQTQGWGIIVIG
jgi:hypothetical protein